MYKQLDGDEMNAVGRLYMQLSYIFVVEQVSSYIFVVEQVLRKEPVVCNPFIHQDRKACYRNGSIKIK